MPNPNEGGDLFDMAKDGTKSEDTPKNIRNPLYHYTNHPQFLAMPESQELSLLFRTQPTRTHLLSTLPMR
jgi:hypothetical protein